MGTNEHISALTGIRALFAFLVVFLHIDMSTNWLDAVPAIRDGLVFSGGAGVNFFFILSGFILAYTQTTGGFTQKRCFYHARFARIYPVYLLGLVLTVPFILTHDFHISFKPETPLLQTQSLILQSVLMQAWYPPFAINWNAPGWSLSVEFFFYALFPFIAPFFMRQKTTRLLAFIGIFYIISVGSPILFHGLGLFDLWTDGALNQHSLHHNFFYYFPLIRLPEFLTGLCLAGVFLKNREYVSRIAPLLLKLGFIGLLVSLQLGPSFLPLITLNNGGLGPFVCCIILGLIGARDHQLTKVFGSPCFVILGRSSYSLYILHMPILFIYLAFLPQNIHAAAAIALYLGIVTGLSIGAYYFLERPMQKFIMKYNGASKQETGAETALRVP